MLNFHTVYIPRIRNISQPIAHSPSHCLPNIYHTHITAILNSNTIFYFAVELFINEIIMYHKLYLMCSLNICLYIL